MPTDNATLKKIAKRRLERAKESGDSNAVKLAAKQIIRVGSNAPQIDNNAPILVDTRKESTQKEESQIGKQFISTKDGLVPFDEYQAPERTTEERARSRVDAQLGETAKLGEELFGESPVASSLEQRVNELVDTQKRKSDLAKKEVDLLNKQDEEQIQQLRRNSKSAIGATKAGLSSGREGPQSAGNQLVSNEFATEMERRINSAVESAQFAREQRREALIDLAEAQKAGRADLVQQAQAALDEAEFQIKKADTDYLSELNQQTSLAIEVQAATRANLDQFKGFLDSGTELSTNDLISYSNTTGLPFETVYGLYEGARSIRENKSLTNEEKKLELIKLKDDVDSQLKGLQTQEAKKVNDYIKLVQSGSYTPEQIQAFAVSMDIPNEKNPIYQAELGIKTAEAKIKQAQANGQLIDPRDQIDLYTRQAELNELLGRGGEAYVPKKSLEGLTVDYMGGKLMISGNANKDYQCGEFVNRVWGLSSGGSGGFGDSYQSKLGKIDISSGQINELNFTQVVKPGMAFVMGASGDASKYGHVGIVTQVNPDGTFLTAETNIPGDKVNNSPATEKLRSYKDVDGFVAPPEFETVGQSQGGSGQVSDLNRAISSLSYGSVNAQETAKSTMGDLLNSGDLEGAKEFLMTSVRNNATATEREKLDGKKNAIRALEDIGKMLDEFESKGGDTGVFTGLKEKALQKGGLTSDPDLAALSNNIAIAIVDYRKAVSGAAFTESEAAAYDAIFPSVGKTTDLNKAKIDSLTQRLQTDRENFFKDSIGSRLYDQIYGSAETNEQGDFDGFDSIDIETSDDLLNLF